MSIARYRSGLRKGLTVLSSYSSRKLSSLSSTTFGDRQFKTLVEMQEESCRLYKDNKYLGTWINDDFKYITYGEFGVQVEKCRCALSHVGVGINDKVAIISNNRVEWAVTYYAANILGAQVIPLYEAQTEADWKYIVDHSDAKVLIVATDAIYQKTRHFVHQFKPLETIICFDSAPQDPHSFQRLIDNAPSTPPSSWKPTEDHLSAIVYTSGSTGVPKGVEITHKNFVSNIYGIADAMGEEKVAVAMEQSSVCYLPWSHIFGLTCALHTSLASGGRVALVPNRESIIKSTEIVQPYELSSVPLLLNKVFNTVTATVAASNPIRKRIVAAAFSVARRRNQLVQEGKPVNSFLAL
jgi:long-chain acyl-CoA synthetase